MLLCQGEVQPGNTTKRLMSKFKTEKSWSEWVAQSGISCSRRRGTCAGEGGPGWMAYLVLSSPTRRPRLQQLPCHRWGRAWALLAVAPGGHQPSPSALHLGWRGGTETLSTLSLQGLNGSRDQAPIVAVAQGWVGSAHPSSGCLASALAGPDTPDQQWFLRGNLSSRCHSISQPSSLLRKPLTVQGGGGTVGFSVTTHRWPHSLPDHLAPPWAPCLGPWVDCLQQGSAHSVWWPQPSLWLSCPLLEMKPDRPSVSHQVPPLGEGRVPRTRQLFWILPGGTSK